LPPATVFHGFSILRWCHLQEKVGVRILPMVRLMQEEPESKGQN
jgi:hypothetical protein